MIATVFFYTNLLGLPIAFPWGGRWAGPVGAGSDEGEPGGFHGVGHSPTGPRWLRGSSTLRYSTSPPHQSAPLTASPRGEAYVLCYVGVIAMAVFYISYTGLANRLPLGGEGGPALRAGSDEGER